MRRFFYVVGALCTLIVVVVVGLIAVTAYLGSGMDAASRAYVDRAVVDIGQHWDRMELLNRASPTLRAQASPDKVASLFEQLTKLGKLVHYDGAKGQATMSFIIRGDSGTRAHYEADATFENGPAHFRFDLSKHDKQWMIDSFFVDLAPILGNPLVKPI
jgi:hypothetical protein